MNTYLNADIRHESCLSRYASETESSAEDFEYNLGMVRNKATCSTLTKVFSINKFNK